MAEEELGGFCFFGGFVKGYPKSEVIRKGLEAHGIPVSTCRTSHKNKIFRRYFSLIFRYLTMPRNFSVIFVPEFRHKDVPLAWCLGKLSGKYVIFDPLVSRYETKIKDRADASVRSFQAWYNRRIDCLSMRLPDLVLADTEIHARYYSREFKAKASRIAVLPVGFDESLFNNHRPKAPCVNDNKYTVLFFGSYVPLHGVETIVKAAALLKDRSDIAFRLIGEGQTYPGAKALADKAMLSNVEFMPRVTYTSLPEYISQADICLGIFGETEKASMVIPNKIYQCLAMRKPVITADTPAIREAFSDNVSICLVPPGDSVALAQKIVYLVSNSDARDRLADEGFKIAHANYNSKVIAGRLVDVCEHMLGLQKK